MLATKSFTRAGKIALQSTRMGYASTATRLAVPAVSFNAQSQQESVWLTLFCIHWKIDFFLFLIDVCLVILQSGKVWATLAASVAVAAATASVAFCEEGAGEVKGKVVVKDKNMANLKDANSKCNVFIPFPTIAHYAIPPCRLIGDFWYQVVHR